MLTYLLSIFKLAKFEKGSSNYSKRNLLNYIVIFKTWFKHRLWWNVSHYGLGTEALSQLYPSHPSTEAKRQHFSYITGRLGLVNSVRGVSYHRCEAISSYNENQEINLDSQIISGVFMQLSMHCFITALVTFFCNTIRNYYNIILNSAFHRTLH